MKNTLSCTLLILFLALGSNQTFACEVCGCGVGGPSSGLSPFADQTFISVRQRLLFSDSHLNSGQRFRTQEQFLRYDVQARVALNKELLLQASVPYSFNSQEYVLSGDKFRLNGFGDVVLNATYIAVNIKPSAADSINIGGSVLLSAGVSLPTGRHTYDTTSIEDVANANFQLGSGSIDPIVSLIGTIRDINKGIRGSISLRYPTTNSMNYRFGESVLSSVSAFIEVPTFFGKVIPSLGMLSEVSAQNTRNRQRVDVTGGYGLLVSGACTFQFAQFVLDAQLDVPLTQEYGSGSLNYGVRSAVSVGILL